MSVPTSPGFLLSALFTLLLGGLAGWWLRGRRGENPSAPAPGAPVSDGPATPSPAESREAATVGFLVAGVAHEVRNPLFSISATLDAFEARFGEEPEYQPYTRVLRTELHRISGLIEQLLEYGRPSVPVFAPARLSEVLRRAIEDAEPQAREGNAMIQVASVAGAASELDPPLQLDADRLVRALRHLLQNAIQFSAPGGRIQVGVGRPDGRTIRVVVEDSGPGLPDGDPLQVFEPFFTRRRGGAGLGLSIARRIAREHGGTLTAANRAEGGARFELSLPLQSATAPAALVQPTHRGAAGSSPTPSARASWGAPQG